MPEKAVPDMRDMYGQSCERAVLRRGRRTPVFGRVSYLSSAAREAFVDGHNLVHVSAATAWAI